MAGESQLIHIKLAIQIIKQQEFIVGPVAWSEAKKVDGLVIKGESISIKGEGKMVLESLVKQYETLFGRASIEVCREAIKGMISTVDKNEIPDILH